jgi:hypothetical protein
MPQLANRWHCRAKFKTISPNGSWTHCVEQVDCFYKSATHEVLPILFSSSKNRPQRSEIWCTDTYIPYLQIKFLYTISVVFMALHHIIKTKGMYSLSAVLPGVCWSYSKPQFFNGFCWFQTGMQSWAVTQGTDIFCFLAEPTAFASSLCKITA